MKIKNLTIQMPALISLTAKTIAFVFVLGISLASCEKETVTPSKSTETADSGYVQIPLHYGISNVVTQETKALSSTDESAVISVYVISFQVNGADSPKNNTFLFAKKATLNSGGTFTAQVIAKPNISQKLYFIANADPEVDAAINQLTGTKTEEEVLSHLVYSMVRIDPGTSSRKLPMWGKSKVLNISPTTRPEDFYLNGRNAIAFLRAFARVNVYNRANGFQLRSVTIYNASNRAAIVPAQGNLVPDGWSRVTNPTIPQGVSANTPQSFNVSGQSLVNTIYMAESQHVDALHLSSATCMIVGGSYKGSSISYYRIDFIDQANNRLDILRNYSYNVAINSIASEGFSSIQEAYNSKPINGASGAITVSAGVNELVTDGKDYLALGKTSVEEDGQYRTLVIPVYTSVSTWSATASQSYLTLSFTATELRVRCPRYNFNGNVKIRAGRLSIEKQFTPQSTF